MSDLLSQFPKRLAASADAPRLAALFAELGIDPAWISERGLPVFPEAQRLAPLGLGTDGRDKFLTPTAAAAWQRMTAEAAEAGVQLLLVSAFRSLDYQAALIRAKLKRGMSIEEILRVNAPPGCSEHHTGRAVDIGEAGTAPLEDDFEKTASYTWLTANAERHGFRLSYPRDNRHGYLYEPWHWCYSGRRGGR